MRAVVYTNPNCQPCKATKRKLTALGAEFDEVSISEEIGAELRSQGFLSAPVVEVHHDEWGIVSMWAGYKPDEIEANFGKTSGLSGYPQGFKILDELHHWKKE